MKLPKVLTQYCPKYMKLPEILTQNRPNYKKLPKILPEIWTLYTNRGGGGGGQCPPGPPTSYAYGVCAVSLLSCVHSLGLGLDLGNSLDWKKRTHAHARVVKLPKKTRRLIPNDTRDFSATPAATKYFAA